MEKNLQIISDEKVIREEMLVRTLRSEEDIKAGRVYTLEEAKERIKKKLENYK